MSSIADLNREKVKQVIEYQVKRKELWLKQCCDILYPNVSFLDLLKQIAKDNLTLYENVDKVGEYHLAYSYDFVEEKYLDYIAHLNNEGYTFPTYIDGSLLKRREIYDLLYLGQ